MASLALGIDVGTSATKAVLVDGDGQIVDSARAEHGFDQPQPGFAEQDAEAVWWDDTVAVIRAADRRSARRAGGGLRQRDRPVRADRRSGRPPLHPAILYGIDSRASAEIDELNDELGVEEILASAAPR